MIAVDCVVKNIGQLVNPGSDRVVRGRESNTLRVQENVCIAAQNGIILFIGPEADFQRQCRLEAGGMEIDAQGFVALPGFVDPHTHLPFAGTRQDEFQLKLQGVSYQEIASRGGGIKGTVRKTRGISRQDLVVICQKRLELMLLSGTTTLEAKSGYGLDSETELKQLEALKSLSVLQPLDIVPTFMGAHEIPDEFSGNPRAYLEFVLAEVLPEVATKKLAEFVDIFCEQGYFSYADAEFYLTQAAARGFKLKVHADEFSSNGAGELAARLHARSAEHLIAVSDAEIAKLAPSDTACVLLPGVSFFLKLGHYAPAQKILAADGIVALGSDFNPGSSMISSQLFIFQLAVFQMGLTIEQALNAVTINAAYAIDRQEQVGSLSTGKKLDLLLLDIPDYRYLAYQPGIQPVHTVLKSARRVVDNRRIVLSPKKAGGPDDS
ncbi:MAG: imidazolonepropionase [Candidatus Aminicenantes bacterium]|nr:imidazolonepropionase [Candidatus Aminicenantes bacterium]